MELWITVTLAAAFFQTIRFMLQKRLSQSALSATGATFARFLYSAPLVVVLCSVYLTATDVAFPSLSTAFWLYGAIGGLAQVFATVCLVALFGRRNFAVGVTFKKTEVLQTVLFGFLILGEGVTSAGFGAIMIGLIGVMVLSGTPKTHGGESGFFHRMLNRSVGLGLLSGVFFAISGVCYRGASLEIASIDPLVRASVTLAAVTSMQLVGMTIWLRMRDATQIAKVVQAWRTAGWIGLTSMAGSLCWFTAFTLQNAAYVNALGQVELIFSLMASMLFFREKITGRELLGITLLGVSILVLVLTL